MSKTRLDLECICSTCGMHFIICGIDHIISHNGGYHISGLECPNCSEKKLDFDLMKVKDTGWTKQK